MAVQVHKPSPAIPKSRVEINSNVNLVYLGSLIISVGIFIYFAWEILMFLAPTGSNKGLWTYIKILPYYVSIDKSFNLAVSFSSTV